MELNAELGYVLVKLLRSSIAICQKAGLLVGLMVVWLGVNISSAWAAPPEVTDGAVLFENYCAGCHPQGGNIVRRRKTLKLKSLERDGYDTLEPLTQLVSKGQNNMPGYEEKLNDIQIETLSQFVLEQANQGWK